MVASAWIIGSITLLIVKQDKKTGDYRESIQTFRHYAKVHGFPRNFEKKLRGQLQLEFNNREISDEHVLGNFPAETRRKVLRKLYLPSLMQTTLMRGIRQQFVDAFLTSCKVEIYSAGDDILQSGAMCSELYLLVAGKAEVLPSLGASAEQCQARAETSFRDSRGSRNALNVNSGEFINAISFFTESPQAEIVRTKTVCKTLTMSRAVYKMIAEDHPASVTKLLQNLLENLETTARKTGEPDKVSLPTKLATLEACSFYSADDDDDSSLEDAYFQGMVASIQAHACIPAVQDLVKMQHSKMKEDQTTRFLFAASRDDAETIDLMCDQGFDPNSSGYEHKTALMVAATQGNTKAVEIILKHRADPNLVDIHGSSALYEAAINGHDDVIEVLLKSGAKLEISEAEAASRVCQAVFEKKVLKLHRLLKVGMPVDAADYNKRRPVHVAAAEASVAALQILVAFGADLSVKDRWGKTVEDEAIRVGADQVLTYLRSLRDLR